MIVLELPYPPSVNSYWRHAMVKGAPRVLVSEAGRKYRKAVGDSVLLHRDRKAPHGRLEVGIMAYMPDRRTRDLDNINKALLDALVHAGVMSDDSLIDKLTVERGPVFKGGKVRVFISEVSHDQSRC